MKKVVMKMITKRPATPASEKTTLERTLFWRKEVLFGGGDAVGVAELATAKTVCVAPPLVMVDKGVTEVGGGRIELVEIADDVLDDVVLDDAVWDTEDAVFDAILKLLDLLGGPSMGSTIPPSSCRA
jgi:hypothetical protein